MIISRRYGKQAHVWIANILTIALCTAFIFPGMSGVPASRVFAADYVVNSTDDGIGGSCPGTTCTLRAALTAVSSGDTITFDSSLNGETITLESSLPPIQFGLSIVGPGADNLTIEVGGEGGFRHFSISPEGEDPVAISGLTLTTGDGVSGGGIASYTANLVLDDMVIADNSTDSDDGGGIYAIGDGDTALTILNSTISGNNAEGGDGGGIWASDVIVTIVNSTISGNTATFDTQAEYGGYGGGVYLANEEGSSMSVAFSTITNNAADIDGQGGGIYSEFGNTVTLWHTIVANQAQGDDCMDEIEVEPDNIISLGYNLDSDDTCDLIESSDQPETDPMLGPLQDNGGSTHTHALLAGSPAIDAGDPLENPPEVVVDDEIVQAILDEFLDLSYDQRGDGYPRVLDGDSDSTSVVDIGAYEKSPDDAPTVDSTDPADAATDVPIDASVVITFSEAVTLGTGWYTLECDQSGSHTATQSSDGNAYTLTPDEPFAYGETCTVTVVATEVSDSDSDDPPDTMAGDYTFSFTTEEDTNPPDTRITSTGGITTSEEVEDDSITFEFTGSDDEGGIDHYECRLDDGDFTVCESPMTYEGLEEGDHRFEVRAIDENGNTDPTPAVFEWTIVSIAPVPVITSDAPDPTSDTPITITITFSEVVTGFTLSDLQVTNATASDFAGSGDIYTVALSPLASGLITVEVGADVVYDEWGHGNVAADPFSITYRAPAWLSLGISAPETTVPGDSLTYTLTYENLSDDDASDVQITLALPDGVTPDLNASPAGWQCQGVLCTYSLSMLAAHQQDTLTLVVTVGSTVQQNAVLRAEATIQGTFSGELQSTDPVFAETVVSAPVSALVNTNYIPLILYHGSTTEPTEERLPDLVITSMSLVPDQDSYAAGDPVQVVVTVQNQGNAPAPQGFWVDVYINPAQVPTENTLWYDSGMCGMDPCFGLAWDVPALAPGESATLISEPTSEAPAGTIGYASEFTMWYGWFANGNSDSSDFPTALYGYVDSWGGDRNTNGIVESVETNNDASLPTITVTGENPEIPYPRIPVDLQSRSTPSP